MNPALVLRVSRIEEAMSPVVVLSVSRIGFGASTTYCTVICTMTTPFHFILILLGLQWYCDLLGSHHSPIGFRTDTSRSLISAAKPLENPKDGDDALLLADIMNVASTAPMGAAGGMEAGAAGGAAGGASSGFGAQWDKVRAP